MLMLFFLKNMVKLLDVFQAAETFTSTSGKYL